MKHNWQIWFWVIVSVGMIPPHFPLFGQDVQETQQVVVVEVPVQVIRNGSPVAGLTADNFALFDNGRRQEILNVQEIVWQNRDPDIEAQPTDLANVRPTDRRHYLLVFDLYFSSLQTLRKATRSALDLVNDGLQPQDLVSVALFRPGSGVTIFTGFTEDRERVTQALQQLNDLTFRRNRRNLSEALEKENLKKLDPLLLASNRGDEPLPGILFQAKLEAARLAINDRGGTLPGLKRLKRELGKMAHMVKVGIPDGTSDGAIRLAYSGALLANAFREIEGRKYMVLLSEGYPNWVLTSERYGAMVRSHQESMFRVFRQTGWAVHSIDIKGLRPNGANVAQDGLFQMAADTGGKFYKNYNNPTEAFEKLLSNTSVVYRLTFTPDRLKNDASYHRIKVKLKDVPLGARIQYARRGYHAPSPLGTERKYTSAKKAAMILGEDTLDSLDVKVMAQTMVYKKLRSKVAVIFEATGEAVLADHDGPELELEAFVYALNANRDIVDFSAQTFSLNLSKNKFMMMRSPRIFSNLDLPAGDYQLRYLLLNTLTQAYSLGSLPFAVAHFEKNVPQLHAPIFPRTFDAALFVNLRADRFIFEEQSYPFVVGDYIYIPRVDPILAPKNRQPLVMQIVEGAKGRWQFSYRILNMADEELDAGVLKTEKGSAVKEAGVLKILGRLNLKTHSAGQYQLEVTAKDPKRSIESTQRVRFRIGEPGTF